MLDSNFILADLFAGEEGHIFGYFSADEERGVFLDCIFIFFLLFSFSSSFSS